MMTSDPPSQSSSRGEALASRDAVHPRLVISRSFTAAEEVGAQLPEAACRFTQLTRGDFVGGIERVELAGSAMHYLYSSPETLNASFLDGAEGGFVMPFRWSGDLVWDGRPVSSPRLFYYPPGAGHVRRGRAVEGVALSARPEWLSGSIAALLDVDPDGVRVERGEVSSPPLQRARLLSILRGTIHEVRSAPRKFLDPRAQEIVAGRVREAALAAVMATSRIGPERRSHVDAIRIVGAAERCFEEARDHFVSLADLCRAAGVSARKLQYAFECTCGMPPRSYFKQRRLSMARLALLEGEPAVGAVKRAALDAGFLHLGRFSVEYRAMFNESPSDTLRRSR